MPGFGDTPYGLRDIKLVPEGVTPTPVDLPAARQLSVKPRITAAEIKGDDVLKAAVSFIEGAEWSLEAGGISLEAYAVLTGATAESAGVTPARTVTTTVVGGQNMPYFKIYGQAMGESGSDIHCKIFKAKVTSLDGTFGTDAFYVTQCSGIAVPDSAGDVYEFVQNETSTALPTT